MLQNKTKEKHYRRASSSALDVVVARLGSPVIDDVTVILAFSPNHGADGEELLQHGFHRTLHSFSSSGVGLGVHGLEQGSKVEAGVPKIEMAEDARQG